MLFLRTLLMLFFGILFSITDESYSSNKDKFQKIDKLSSAYKNLPDSWCVNNDTSKKFFSISPPIPVSKENKFSKKKCTGETNVINKDYAINLFSSQKGREWLCNYFINEDGSVSFKNKNLDIYQNLANVLKLECKINKDFKIQNLDISELKSNPNNRPFKLYPDRFMCEGATIKNNNKVEWNLKRLSWIREVKFRNLSCGVKEDNKTTIATNQIKDPSKRPLASLSDTSVCYNATTTSGGKKVWNDRNDNFVGEAKYRGLVCGVKNSNKTVIVSDEDIAGSIWKFYDEDGDVRLYFFKKDNTFIYKNLISITGNEGKVFGDNDEKWSVQNNIVLVSHSGGYNKRYFTINDMRDVMKGVSRNVKGKGERIIGKLENKEVIFKNGNFFKYRKPSKKNIAIHVAETKNIKIKFADISKIKIPTNISNSIKKYAKNIKNNELEKEKQKIKSLEQKLALLEQEKEKRIKEERKRKELEKKLAALQSENKKQIKIAKQNEIGSGFYVSKFRHVVTNQHVVNKCKKITVGDSMTTQIPADMIALDKRNDLAILQTISMDMASAETKSFIQNLSIQIVPIVSGGLIRVEDVKGGEQVYVAGFPHGNMISDSMRLVPGLVNSTRGFENDITQFETDAVIRKGNSGGPVYDNRGNIVGIAVKRFNVTRSDNYNFAIKGSTVKQFLDAHNILTTPANRTSSMTSTKIYNIASKQTVMVLCHRD